MPARGEWEKEEGNRFFKIGQYEEANYWYTQAITKNPKNPKFFTNRARARLRLHHYDSALDDSIRSIEAEPGNMKGFYILAEAQLALNHPNEALSSALTAYSKCLQTLDPSTQNVSNLVLQAKKKKWEAKERDRLRRMNGLLRELEEALVINKENQLQDLKYRRLGPVAEMEEKSEIEMSASRKIEDLLSTFAVADPENMQRREVPDYLIDSISFTIMHDPVVTKTGNSYDRSTVIEHLKRSQTDPLTREPLRMEDLRPNLALKSACEEFLAENGWAVDW